MTDVTYAVQHPQMNMAAMVTANINRKPRGIIAQVSMHILRTFDEMLAIDEFVIREVDADTLDIDLFARVDMP